MRDMSFCKPVRSYRRGGFLSCRLRSTLVMVTRMPGMSMMSSRCRARGSWSMRWLVKCQPPMSRMIFQNGVGRWLSICRSRRTIMPRVGVWTRPTVKRRP